MLIFEENPIGIFVRGGGLYNHPLSRSGYLKAVTENLNRAVSANKSQTHVSSTAKLLATTSHRNSGPRVHKQPVGGRLSKSSKQKLYNLTRLGTGLKFI